MPKTKKRRNSKQKKKSIHVVEDILSTLNEKQKLFALLYTTDKSCFGNASLSYRTAYNLTPAQYKAAEVSAHWLLRNPKVQAFIKKFLEDSFNERCVDNETAKVMNQDKDLHAKMKAIETFNNIKNRANNTATLLIPVPLMDLNAMLKQQNVPDKHSNKEDSSSK